MLGSLRFRLPALFLLGILLSGLVATLISIRFFQSYNRARAVDELRSESVGIVQLYAQQAGGLVVSPRRLEGAIGGDRVFWAPAFRGATLLQQIPDLPRSVVSIRQLDEQRSRNFLMSVSHELRTPLTAIRGHLAAVREGVIDDPAMRDQSLAVIGEEALRLERLVGDVLDLAKLDAHRFTVLQEEVDMER